MSQAALSAWTRLYLDRLRQLFSHTRHIPADDATGARIWNMDETGFKTLDYGGQKTWAVKDAATSHFLQPADRFILSSFKDKFKKEALQVAGKKKSIGKDQFVGLIRASWSALSKATVVASWRATRLWPRDVIWLNDCPELLAHQPARSASAPPALPAAPPPPLELQLGWGKNGQLVWSGHALTDQATIDLIKAHRDEKQKLADAAAAKRTQRANKRKADEHSDAPPSQRPRVGDGEEEEKEESKESPAAASNAVPVLQAIVLLSHPPFPAAAVLPPVPALPVVPSPVAAPLSLPPSHPPARRANSRSRRPSRASN